MNKIEKTRQVYSKMLLFVLGMIFCAQLMAQEKLSVDDYRQKVLSYNQTIQIATQTIDAVQSMSKEIKTGYFPKISGSGTFFYNFNPLVFEFHQLSANTENISWGINAGLQQNIYTGGKLSAAHKQTNVQEEIATLNQQLAINNMTYNADVSYWNSVACKEMVDVSNEYLNIVNALYKTVETRYNDGYISKTDLLKTETTVKDAQFQLSKSKQVLTQSIAILNVLMGTNPDSETFQSDSIQTVMEIPVISSLDSTLSRRPEYLIKEQEIEYQRQQWRLDRSEFLPKAAVGAQMSYGTYPINFDNSRLLFSPVVYAQLSLPIFEWGKSVHSKNKNKELAFIKELEKSETQDAIKSEISVSLANIKETANQISIVQENLKIAQESLSLHTFSYDEGRVTVLDVQSAQLAWLQAYVNFITAHLNNKIAIANYKKVTATP